MVSWRGGAIGTASNLQSKHHLQLTLNAISPPGIDLKESEGTPETETHQKKSNIIYTQAKRKYLNSYKSCILTWI